MGVMQLAALVETSRALAATRSRKAKVAALAAALRQAAPDEVETATAYLSGVLRQRRTGLGWRSLTDLPPPADQSTLTVAEVHDTLEQISTVTGAGSKQARADLVDRLFGRATAEEQEYLRRLVTGDLRQGALDGLMLEAIAAAAGVPATAVRRASMLCGATLPVAVAALTGGEEALGAFGLEVGRPLRPMLASSAPDLPAALEKLGPGERIAVDCKLDGIRVQVHKYDGQVRVFTRTLDDITDRLPEVVEAVSALPAQSIVLDGEAIALDASGRPRPFQETAARTASRLDVATLREQVPLTSYFFDLLHLDGADLLDLPARERFAALADCAARAPRGPSPADRRPHGGRLVLRLGGRARPRGRGGEEPRRSLRGGTARRVLGQGQASPHVGSGGAGRGVGKRSPLGPALEHPPRRP